MNHRTSPLVILFTLVMLACCIFLVWYTFSSSSMVFRLQDTRLSLETSQGRERKQQAEYEQVSQELPETRQALEVILPEAEAAQAQVDALKAERKALREQKADLESKLAQSQTTPPPGEGTEGNAQSDLQEESAHE